MMRKLILAALTAISLSPAFAQAPPPVPALPDTERRTSYVISGSTCSCSVGFMLFGDSTDYANWIEVWINGTRLTQAGNWTITSPTGSLATIPRPVTDAVLTFTQAQTGTVQIVGARRPRRTAQFAENRGVAARDLNQALTDIIAQNRETWDKINDVTGRAVLAPPGETLAILASANSRKSQGACFDSNGNLVACVSIPSSTFTAGNGIALTGVGPTTITNNIQGSGPITITGTNPLIVGCATCNTSPAAATPAVFVASRTAAIALDLHTYTVVRTGGYAAGGDGGGATFKNVGSTPFKDSFISTGSLTAPGSAYTNGTYRGVLLTGGTGYGVMATITIAGNVVTTVALTGTGGNGYTAGDVLSATAASVGGTGTGFTWTVSAVTTATGSFTDSVGTRFQIVQDEGAFINTKQFGAKVDWTKTGGDAAATNDTLAIQNALNFASAPNSPTYDAGGTWGNTVITPKGMSLAGALQVPDGVHFRGLSSISSGLKAADALGSTAHFITLCDPLRQTACFGAYLTDMLLFPSGGGTTGAPSMVFSNNIQQMDAISRLQIYSSTRVCIYLDTGWGGAAQVGFNNIDCTIGSTNAGIIVSLGSSQTNVNIRSITVSSGSVQNTYAIQIAGGFIEMMNVDIENITNGILLNVPANAGLVRMHHIKGSPVCVDLITRANTSIANMNVGGALNPAGCTHTINNAGAMTTGYVVGDVVF